jgi:predicted amidohydrolase
MTVTRIYCHQIAPVLGDLAANQAKAVTAITASAARGADVIVLPELVLSGYMFESTEEARSLAVRPDDAVFAAWADAAGDTTFVVGGFPELGEDGNLYNSAAVVDRHGIIAVYRKVHLWDQEKRFFTPGAEAPPVIDTAAGRIGVLICYDLEFPEMTRGIALGGADLIAAPTNWPYEPRPDGEEAPTVSIARAAARVSRTPIACCDRSATERGQAWNQGTSIIDADGFIVAATASTDGVISAEIDLQASRDKTVSPLGDAYGDRRPGVYAQMNQLTAEFGAAAYPRLVARRLAGTLSPGAEEKQTGGGPGSRA